MNAHRHILHHETWMVRRNYVTDYKMNVNFSMDLSFYQCILLVSISNDINRGVITSHLRSIGFNCIKTHNIRWNKNSCFTLNTFIMIRCVAVILFPIQYISAINCHSCEHLALYLHFSVHLFVSFHSNRCMLLSFVSIYTQTPQYYFIGDVSII